MTCDCELVLSAEDTESLLGPAKAHFDQEHPDYRVTLANLRNYLESEDRSTGPTERLATIGDVEIVPITPERAADAIEFFDRDAFPDNPWWGACYCMFFPLGGRQNEGWGEERWQDNRRDQMKRIEEGRTTGMLAYAGGKVVGWCNATARSEFPSLATGEDEGVISVVCFVIAPPYRGQGVATGLLEGVIGNSRGLGFSRLEAYPVRSPADEARAFHGTLDLFERFGFVTVSEDPLTVTLDLT
jgi:GNAT superfamily N-acetyltransferase